MPGQRINWARTFLIIGSATALIGVRFIFSFYGIFQDDFASLLSILVKRGFLESVIALFLFAVIARKTTREDIRYLLKNTRVYIVIITLFLVGGFAVGVLLQSLLHGLLQGIFEDLAREGERILSIPTYQQSIFIFGNNSGVAVLSGIFAPFFPVIGLLVPPFIMFFNGIVIGAAPGIIEMSWAHYFAAILPHGILELPALVLASAVGMRFGVSVLKACIGYVFPPLGLSGRDMFLREIRPGWQSLKLFAVVIPMLVVAAVIEAFVTPQVMRVLGI